MPVFVDNEANAGAMGEKFCGVGRDTANLVYVSVGAGIGTGIILNNELIRGEQGITGEFGHMTIEVDGRVCSCGNRGCLEMYASEKALMEQYEHIAGESLPTHEIVERAKAQEPEAIQAVKAVGAYLGIGIATLLNGLNPSLILIGSRMRAVDDVLLASIDPVVKARCFTHPYANFRILPSSLGVNACAIGAASLVLHQHFVGPKAHL
ncbi:ROK family protein [Alicyclobacillus fodiniaquatilis]|uniref:ROK family protein n=1 Tax=Alicyclobacillus fodiniaquatilis TaxID=1661150 RepID=A0ABW4JJ56_9BACL